MEGERYMGKRYMGRYMGKRYMGKRYMGKGRYMGKRYKESDTWKRKWDEAKWERPRPAACASRLRSL